jgi:hypothetical protein
MCRFASAVVALAICLFASTLPTESQAAAYTVVRCGGVFEPCTVTATRRTPTATELSGLTNDLLLKFYVPILQGQTGIFDIDIRDSSESGYIIGHVDGPNIIHTEFVFKDGELLCCFTDEPFRINDINSKGVVVGHNFYDTGPYIAKAPFAENGDLPEVDPDGIPISFYWNLEAIDDSGNILAYCYFSSCEGEYFELRVNEPGTLSLFLAAFLGLFLWRRRATCSVALFAAPARQADPQRKPRNSLKR